MPAMLAIIQDASDRRQDLSANRGPGIASTLDKCARNWEIAAPYCLIRLSQLSDKCSPTPLVTVTPQWTTMGCEHTGHGRPSFRIGRDGSAAIEVARSVS
ncbi:hypothetical protein GCM10023322_78840 [Rugosimonospora acidiphila]|uniref:Uncharacterized protein n=1 Tax=Rugosimonospora acidiphila TaxID=556531 RepID=A0ABP9SSX7_9ACTN